MSCGPSSDDGDHDSVTFDRVWVEMDTFKNYDINFDRLDPSTRVERSQVRPISMGQLYPCKSFRDLKHMRLKHVAPD